MTAVLRYLGMGLGLGSLCLLAAVSATPAAHAEPLVVVEARGLPLQPGQLVDGDKPLPLKEGQQVVLISQAGETLRLRGPFAAAPSQAAASGTADVAAAMGALVGTAGGRSGEAAVVRGTREAVPPDAWLLDVTHSGNRCLLPDHPPTFWRPGGGAAALAAATVTISPYDRSWTARAAWPAGSDRLAVPATVPLKDRASYVVTLAGKTAAITLIALPATLGNDAMRAAWMTAKECQSQAAALQHPRR